MVGHNSRVAVVAGDVQVEEADARGAVVLLDHIHFDFELVNFIIFVAKGRFEGLVLQL